MMMLKGWGCPKVLRISLLVILLISCFEAAPRIAAASDCGPEIVCHEALVKFSRRLSASDIQDILQRHGAVTVRQFHHLRLYHLSLPDSGETAGQVEALAREFGVLQVSPNWIVYAQILPNDPEFDELWGMHNVGTPEADIGMDAIWDNFTDASSVLVAVIDSGVNYNHPDLAANMWTNPGEIAGNGLDDDGNGFIDDVHGFDFRNNDSNPMDDHGHGTHVSGTLGAVGNNGIGVAGVAWKAQIMAVKFLSAGASGNLSDAIAGIEYALDNGAMILNNSWGGGGFDHGLFSVVLDSDAAGTIFVAAAGNNGSDIEQNTFYPAGYDSPNVISVASIHENDGLSGFSNYGKTKVDLAAPGSNVYSTTRNGSYGQMSGTSMATPHVSGAAALLWSQFPTLSHRQIIQILLQGVVHKNYLEDITVTEGLLSFPGSLAIASDSDNETPIANAGPDQGAAVGELVTLQGSATDADNDFPLLFEWGLSVPPGSQSQLNDPLDPTPSFLPDREGTYTATLVVSDFISSSVADSAVITIDGVNVPPPVAVIKARGFDPQTSQSVALGSGIPTEVGRPVTLDGSESEGVFSYLMVFQWDVVEKPLNSVAALNDPEEDITSLTPEVPGTYTVRLIVEDGFHESFADFSFVAALPEETDTEQPSEPAPPPSDPQVPSQASGGCSLHKSR